MNAVIALDAAFARAFERGEVGNDGFRHREHLRLAWAYLGETEGASNNPEQNTPPGCSAQATEAACARVGAAIRAFAQRAGSAQRYHETLTQFWVRMLAAVRSAACGSACGSAGGSAGLDAVLAAHPWLLDKDLPLAYYTRALLFGDAAQIGRASCRERVYGTV